MTYICACLAQNIQISGGVDKFIEKCIKKAEKSYVKCKRFISNSFLEKTKRYIQKKKE
jgi:hypothetical protein